MENQNSTLVEENWRGGQKLHQINGFWFPSLMVSGTQQAIVEFNPRPTDIILASFPKTGTTWLKSLLYSIINPSSLDSLVNNSPHDLVPFLEIDVFGESSKPNILSSDGTRIFNTHIPYQLLGKTIESSGCRVVYVTRNPKDTLNSLWHFVNKWKVDEDAPWELEEAVEKFCRGIVPCGPYYEHVLGYRMANLKNPNKDKKVEEIVKSCSFETLSNHKVNKSEDFRPWFPVPNNSFFRQAAMGDHKKYLSEEAIQKIDALTREKFHKCGFIYGIN
nr:cytosolic sulfotransferase 15-like [Ipomoea trifida]